jgi:hypothetical protein
VVHERVYFDYDYSRDCFSDGAREVYLEGTLGRCGQRLTCYVKPSLAVVIITLHVANIAP